MTLSRSDSAGQDTLEREAPLPLSFGQRQLWFLSRLAPESPEYLVPLTLRMRGPLDEQVLARVWTELVRRHETLRTRYVMVGTEPMQVVDPPGEPVWRVTDLSGLPGDEREATALRLAETATTATFDLETEQPLRVDLLRLGDSDRVLVVVVHHIASDQVSQQVMVEEMAALYLAYRDGLPSPLPEPDARYADYAAAQRERLTDDRLAPHLDYWRRQLDGVPRLELPTDRPRPATRGWRGAAVPLTVPAATATRLRGLAKECHSTQFMTLLTGFQCLLARYTDSDDIPVGTVISDRADHRLARMHGYFLNTLVMRLRLGGSASFRDLLGQNRSTVLDAFDHQMVPFTTLVDELEPDRDPSTTPLFQVAFTTHDRPFSSAEFAGLRVEQFPLAWRVGRFDLVLQMADLPDGSLGGQLEYATELFRPETARRIADHLVRLLTSIAEAPDAPVRDLDFLTPGELGRLLARPEPVAESDARCLHGVFADQAARAPQATAVVAGDSRLSYAELDATANRLAHHLVAAGAGAGTLVGVLLDRDETLVPTLLAVTKAGAAYVPLDPANPAERLRFMLEDAGVAVVVTTTRLAAVLGEGYSGRVVVLDGDDAPAIAACGTGAPEVVVGPGDLAYVIYTSGSTGRPKGVCVTHANVWHLFDSFGRRIPIRADDVWPMFHSAAFDLSVWEMWGALLHGGSVVVVPFAISRSPGDFLDLMVAEGVTVLSQTPSAFRGLVGLAADPRAAQLSLRAVIFGGERLDLPELSPWVERFGLDTPALINMYGITETTVHVTFHQLTADDFTRPDNPVGRPLDTYWIHLLDRNGKPVPPGAVGEIHVGGSGVARGYLNRPELTAQRFVPDPFGGPDDRLYRSGDLARFSADDGNLYFVGRIDDQVKLRGFRIEPGEITAALSAHPGVQDAVVVPREDGGGEKKIVAYVVPAGTGSLDPGDLRQLLARTLPEHMIPAAFVTLEKLPLTPNGKLDKNALPAPDDAAVRPSKAIVAPRNATEAKLVLIWAGVLGVDRIGVHDGFFDLGGDSILAVVLAGQLRDHGFGDVPVRDIFDHRSIAQLAQVLDARSAPVKTGNVAPFALISADDRARLPEDVEDAYPLSRVQTGMLVEMLASTAGNVYHNTTSFKVQDGRPFSPDALRGAAAILVRRHEILRTALDANICSVPMQLVLRTAEMPVGVADISALDPDAQHAVMTEFAVGERERRFDLGRPPLLRIFAHVTQDAWWLSLTECHVILEGWSFHSLLMELLTVYGELRDGTEVTEPERPDVRYADFIAAELESIDSPEDRGYWRGIVERYPKFTLPPGWGASGPRESYRVSLPCAELMEPLHGVASKLGVSVKSVLHAAYLKVMSALTDEPAFLTGIVCDTRPEVSGADRVYGMYLNTVPFPFEGTATTWRELIKQVFDRQVELWPHRRFPLAEIQREAVVGERLLDNFFIHLNFRVVDTELVESASAMDDSANEFGLEIAARHDDILLLSHSDVLTEENGRRILAMYRTVLMRMVADVDGDARTGCLSDEERRLVLVDWNRTDQPLDGEGVVERFRTWAAKEPDAVAVADDRETLTYQQLAGRASAISAQLADAPVDSLVAVLDDAGARFVAAVLGTLGAGCAYIPFDTAAPPARTAKLLADSGARYLLAGPHLMEHARTASAFLDVTVLELDDAEHGQAEWLPPRGGEHDLAYVIYTSGSTGMPKGAMVHRRGMLNHLLAKVEDLALTSSDTVVQNAPLTFDVSVWQMLAPLIVGGRVRVVGRAEAADPSVLFTRVEDERIPVLEVVPTLLRAALDGWDAGLPVPDVSGLRWLMVTGEALLPDLCTRWFARFPGVPLVNAYGPTECSDDVTHAFITAETTFDGPVVPIGRAVRNTRLYVLDGRRQPVPIGVPGELYVGGAGVGRGYVNDPERTSQAFAIDPFSNRPGAVMYRTGDRVRYRADGQLEFLGRRDNQVKIRGQRIELGEVESALRATPGVRDAAAKIDTDAGGSARLVGYTVGEAGVAEIREHLTAELPAHLIPAALVVLDELPLTRNGKVDRAALPAPDRSGTAADQDAVAPATPTELRVAGVWGAVLGLETVGTEDDFFAAGGDSIRSLALSSRLRAAGIVLPVAAIFEHRTITAIAAYIDSRTDAADNRALAWISPRTITPKIICVHHQSGAGAEFMPVGNRFRSRGTVGVGVFTADAVTGEHPVDLSELAKEYVQELVADGDPGPVHVVGGCSAGGLVWEMGRQLEAVGLPAASVILVDALADPSTLPNPVVDDPAMDFLADLFERQRNGETGHEENIVKLLRAIDLPLEENRRDGVRDLLLPRMHELTKAMYSYCFTPVSTPVHVVMSDELAAGGLPSQRGQTLQWYLDSWAGLTTGGMTVHRVSGDHQAVFTEAKADELADVLFSVVTS